MRAIRLWWQRFRAKQLVGQLGVETADATLETLRKDILELPPAFVVGPLIDLLDAWGTDPGTLKAAASAVEILAAIGDPAAVPTLLRLWQSVPNDKYSERHRVLYQPLLSAFRVLKDQRVFFALVPKTPTVEMNCHCDVLALYGRQAICTLAVARAGWAGHPRLRAIDPTLDRLLTEIDSSWWQLPQARAAIPFLFEGIFFTETSWGNDEWVTKAVYAEGCEQTLALIDSNWRRCAEIQALRPALREHVVRSLWPLEKYLRSTFRGAEGLREKRDEDKACARQALERLIRLGNAEDLPYVAAFCLHEHSGSSGHVYLSFENRPLDRMIENWPQSPAVRQACHSAMWGPVESIRIGAAWAAAHCGDQESAQILTAALAGPWSSDAKTKFSLALQGLNPLRTG